MSSTTNHTEQAGWTGAMRRAATEPTDPSVHVQPEATGIEAGAGWADASAAEDADVTVRLRFARAVAMLVVVTAGDLVVIKSTLDHVLRLPTAYSWVLSVALATVAVALMWRSGGCGRRAEAAAGGVRRAEGRRAVLLAGAWFAVGVGLFVLRWNAASFTAHVTGFGQAAPADDGAEGREHLLAIVLAAVYLATGGLSWSDGHSLTNPVAAAMRTARRRSRMLALESCVARSRQARLLEHRDIHIHELESIDACRDTAVAAIRALVLQLKEHARVQIAAQLGDPRSSGVVHEPPRSRDVVPGDAATGDAP